jgi:hypothetical protein
MMECIGDPRKILKHCGLIFTEYILVSFKDVAVTQRQDMIEIF